MTGTLPREYSSVVANVTGITNNTDVDCFIEVSGGVIGSDSLCQVVGQATTDVLPPGGYASATLTGVTGEILVKVEAPTQSRAFTVTNEVQCLPSPATECDTSDPSLWTAAPNLYTTGQVLNGFTPNTYYTCFIAATYVENGVKEYVCAIADPNVVLMPPLPPTKPNVAAGPNAGTQIDVTSSEAPNQGDAQPLIYLVQCLEAPGGKPPATCDEFVGFTKVTAAELANTVTVSDLTGDTEYACFAGLLYDIEPELLCSEASDVIRTAPITPGIPTNAQQVDFTDEHSVITWTDGTKGAPEEEYRVDCKSWQASSNAPSVFSVSGIARGIQRAEVPVDPSILWTCYVTAYTTTAKYPDQVSASLMANRNSRGTCTSRDLSPGAFIPVDDEMEPTKEQIDAIVQNQVATYGKPVSELDPDVIVSLVGGFSAQVPICWYLCEDPSSQTITNQRLEDQLAVLNADFADAGISFVEQSRDTCVGQARTDWVTEVDNQADRNLGFQYMRDLSQGRNKNNCVNIYLGTWPATSPLLGLGDVGLNTYTTQWNKPDTLPGGPDGEKSSLGKTVVHETGHNFGLYHTFKGDCSGPGSEVAGYTTDDIPVLSTTVGDGRFCSGVDGLSLSTGLKADSCPQDPGLDPVNNFMSYTHACCMVNFSPQQILIMQAQITQEKPGWVTSNK